MDKSLTQARRRFTILSVSIAIFCALLGGIGVYAVAETRLNSSINASKLTELTSGNPAVSEYLASQEKYNAHFESIAAAIQRDNQQQLTKTLPLLIGVSVLISGLVGWLLSRKLLVPVKETFLSQRRFMQDAAHELRNPLAALTTMVQQARRKPPKDKELGKLLDSMNGQLNHLSAITTDLLLLERREYPGTEQTDIVALIQDILEAFHQDISAKKLQVLCDMPSTFVVNIDPQHFVYMAKNIIENAIKFSDKNKPVIKISLKQVSERWTLVVKDNGIGIPNEDIANITQRFYRGKNTTSIDGTGLGMAIVAKFVNIYRGSLDIKSLAGRGTSVSITL